MLLLWCSPINDTVAPQWSNPPSVSYFYVISFPFPLQVANKSHSSTKMTSVAFVNPLPPPLCTFTPTPTFRAIIWPPALRWASFSVPGSKSSLQRWIVLLCRLNCRPLTGEGRAFSGQGHHAVTWLQGSLHPLFKKHLTRRIAGWLPPLLCWGPIRSLTKHQSAKCHMFHFHSTVYGQNMFWNQHGPVDLLAH